MQPKSWHAITTRLLREQSDVGEFHELQMQPTINQVDIVPDVMVMHNDEGVFQPRGALAY